MEGDNDQPSDFNGFYSLFSDVERNALGGETAIETLFEGSNNLVSSADSDSDSKSEKFAWMHSPADFDNLRSEDVSLSEITSGSSAQDVFSHLQLRARLLKHLKKLWDSKRDDAVTKAANANAKKSSSTRSKNGRNLISHLDNHLLPRFNITADLSLPPTGLEQLSSISNLTTLAIFHLTKTQDYLKRHPLHS